ncbi:MAG: DNA polymerase III subunit delta' [Anaerovibrio sp.]|nr:DNA polymerase III subunit delta' [Anaerovibrio sp.]
MNIQWKNIIGHQKVTGQLRLLQTEDRIPHAMLFCGSEGVGKNLAAEALAAALLCHEPAEGQCCGECPACKALLAGTHPDYFQLVPESSTKAARSIKIEAVRELQSGIARVPLLSGRRVVIIQDAEKMNEAAANCLLKTIEEPGGQVVFILLTSAPAALLDTIVSRCMRVEFGILQPAELREVLLRQGLSLSEAEALGAMADGSAARAMLLHSPELEELRRGMLELAAEAGSLSPERILGQARELSGHSREQLLQWLGFLAMIYRDMLILYSGSELPLYNQSEIHRLSDMLAKYPPGRLLALLRLVQEYQKRLGSNVNVQLCLEGFFIRLNDLVEE